VFRWRGWGVVAYPDWCSDRRGGILVLTGDARHPGVPSRLRRRSSRRKRERGERERRRHPDPGPASARLRELDAGRVGRGARRGGARHLRARAHAGDVRARGSTAPAAGAVSGLSGPVRHLHRFVLAAVRLDRPGHVSGLEDEFRLSASMPGKPPPRWVPPTGCGNAPDCARGRRHVEARPSCSRACRGNSVPRSSRRSSRPDPSSIDVRRSLSCAASQRWTAQARAAAREARRSPARLSALTVTSLRRRIIMAGH